MYNFSDAGSPVISVIFFVLIVLLGAFFTMNLVLAIIVDSFDKQDSEGGAGDDGDEDEGVDDELKKELEQDLAATNVKKGNGGVDAKVREAPEEQKEPASSNARDNRDSAGESSRNPARTGGSLLPSLTGKGTAAQAALSIAEAERRAMSDEHLSSHAASDPDLPRPSSGQEEVRPGDVVSPQAQE